MKTNQVVELIKQYSDIDAVSGFEKPVRDCLENQFLKNNLEVSYDKLGGIIGKIETGSAGPKTLVLAHMDEVGFMVEAITELGFVKIYSLGGFVPSTISGQRLTLHTRNGEKFDGCVLALPKHLQSSGELSIDGMLVDFGFSSKENALEYGVRIGDMVALKNDFNHTINNMIFGKAFDNRFGCTIVHLLAEKLTKEQLCGTIYLAASVQEEVGLRGAAPIVNQIGGVDNILVVDTSPVSDTTTAQKEKGAIGNGVLVRMRDAKTILDVEGNRILFDLALKHNVKAQPYFSYGGATDAADAQVAMMGAKTVALCIPARNIHSNTATASVDDFLAVLDLAELYVKYSNKKVTVNES
ncbi:MAG: M42 family metallopeptidase [Mycoplasmatales bacterium]